MPSKYPILVVDDNPIIFATIEASLMKEETGPLIYCADSRKAMSFLKKEPYDLVLLDLKMPYIGGEELLTVIRKKYANLPVIIVSGESEIETAVRCIKLGAYDYVVKPFKMRLLANAVNRVLQFRNLERENEMLKHSLFPEKLAHPTAFKNIITCNKQMLFIFQYIESIAQTSLPVLINGETGVGKELIALAIHKISERRGEFIPVNIASIEKEMFNDVLFGHTKGAFTGADSIRKGLVESAENGTLFLDEIGDLTLTSQVKLLRFMQEGEYLPVGMDIVKTANIRIIASTHQNLSKLCQNGTFRKDLNYRLRTHHIHIPPLRERKEDIPLLITHFTRQIARFLNIKQPKIPDELLDLLEKYPFPGNIRELQSMIFDSVSRSRDGKVSFETFTSHMQHASKPLQHTWEKDNSTIFRNLKQLPTLKQANHLLIFEAMKRSQGNQSEACKILGVSQPALSKRLKTIEKEMAQP